MPSSPGQTALKAVGSIAIVAASFWGTLQVLDYMDQPGQVAGPEQPGAGIVAPPPQRELTAAPTECANLPSLAGQYADVFPAGERAVIGEGTKPAAVQASSNLSPAQSVGSLFDKRPDTYWHVNVQGQRLPVEWFLVDLGSGPGPQVQYLRVRSRIDAPQQFFTSACLLGSADGQSWRGITKVATPTPLLPGWILWKLDAPQVFRYYKLVIPNQTYAFYSAGKFDLLGP